MYQVTLSRGYAFIYRAGMLVASGRGANNAAALKEALRNVRMARHSRAFKA